MIELDVSYSSKGRKVTGPDKIFAKTVEELFEWVQTNTVVIAKEFLREEQNDGKFPKKEYLTLVDGKVNRKEEQVKVFGKIEYVTKLGDVSAVVLDVMRLVIERSPTVTGYYHSTNVLMFNGRVVAKGLFQANSFLKTIKNFKPTDKFRVINLSPYARKLERLGIKKGTRGELKGQNTRGYRSTKNKQGAKVRAPNGAYWLAKNTARRKYPQLKNNIRFSFIPVSPGIAASQNTKSFKPSGYSFVTGRGKGRPYLYPSISISLNPSSFSSNAGFTEDGAKL